MQIAYLDDRGVVRIAGEDVAKFLNGLLTADIGKVTAARASYAALLTPQGKIIVDFLIAQAPDGAFLLDCPRAEAQTLVQRLSFYKLRAKVTIEDLSERLQVFAVWGRGSETPPVGGQAAPSYPDPRTPDLGYRLIAERGTNAAVLVGAEAADAEAYAAHRIALGVPDGGIDFAYNDAFPHEADMDQLGGIDFQKGCYIGQEVVSRMEHRGTARTRVVPLAFVGAAPAHGTPVTAGGKAVGEIGSAANGQALALLRLDRVAEALAGGGTLAAGGVALSLKKPPWARFAFPDEGKAT
jgi:tRNA-modifying protein YgfZ